MEPLSDNLYESLRIRWQGEIRLLKIKPSADKPQKIQCELKSARLADNPNYIALSYTWGPSTPEAKAPTDPQLSIICNGYSLQITPNLHDFLLHARQDPLLNTRHFWIDSISINQQNNLEKRTQITFMASIYRSAEKVVAWLGFTSAYPTAKLWFRNLPLHPRASRPVDVWSSLKNFWRRNYFSWTWIIQEIVLARKVTAMCGAHFIPWQEIEEVSFFLTVTFWAQHFLSPDKGSHHSLPAYIKSISLNAPEDDNPLLDAVITARQFKCSEPRDKVFAVMGLVEDYLKGNDRSRARYEEQYTVVDAYTGFAVNILKDTENLLILAYSEGEEFRKIKGLPSWVPDWSVNKVLGLGILDCVVEVGETKDEVLNSGGVAYFSGWLEIVNKVSMRYHNGQSRGETFWRTLITDTAVRVNLSGRIEADGKTLTQVDHPAAGEYGVGFRDWFVSVVDRWRKEGESVEKERFLEQVDRLVASDDIGGFGSLNHEGLDLSNNLENSGGRTFPAQMSMRSP
ncbi:heterokaryon incompatibility protein-domain-containing protein [Podospora fimiseda]|uniref:Heterokaryon incompatibility protein-domain-containing protein n=1 Tax=Podospora fimiseda TaxID=252190 RepID=A0AAN6YKU8_9PEZI|nr:heterokaryon incompatibility protein-domain-containing protein [Podospora fimiseda]